MWEICGLVLQAGEKRRLMLHPYGKAYEIPATLICGAREGKTLLVTAQIHAGEYNGSAAAVRLAAEIDAEKLAGNVLIMHCVNTSGFWQRYPRFVPEDHADLNADYPGSRTGTVGKQIAAWFVEEIFPGVDFIADLHGGGMTEALAPCIFFPKADKVRDRALSAAKAMKVKYLLASSNSAGEYGYAASHLDIPGLILECGYGGLTRKAWIRQAEECVRLLLDHLGMYETAGAEKMPAGRKIYWDAEYLETDMRGVWFPAVEEGQAVKKGQLLGTIGDFFGETLREYRAVGDGTVIYYTAGMCVLEGDPLAAYGLEETAEVI